MCARKWVLRLELLHECPKIFVETICFGFQVLCGVKPEEKKKFIRKLQKDKKIVAMVGDGINDAAALASSHVGVAMGGGVGAASEVSSIVLMGNRLSQVYSLSFSI